MIQISRLRLIEIVLGLSLVSIVIGDPKGYGAYDYDGHGHHGYNDIGYVNKVVDYHVRSFLSVPAIKTIVSITLQNF